MSLAAIPDHKLDDRIPEHRAELVKRGLRGCPEQVKASIACRNKAERRWEQG